MYLEIGPAGLLINARKGGMQYEPDKSGLEQCVRGILRDISEYLPVLKQRAWKIVNTSHLSEAARRMTEAVKLVDEKTLTPMAAVAGTVADLVKEYLGPSGLDFISINNGGDLSVFNLGGGTLRIGIGDISTGKRTPCVVRIEGLDDFGMATSGLGGRSLTLGLADIVTVIGRTGAVADAAATYICNLTNAGSDTITRKKASDIDPDTDIPEEHVTVATGELDGRAVAEALGRGLEAARGLKESKVIDEAVIILKGSRVTTIDDNKYITLEVQDGDQENSYHC